MRTLRYLPTVLAGLALTVPVPHAPAAEPAWKELLGEKWQEVWRNPSDQWAVADDAKLDEANPRKLVPVPGKGVLVNGPGRLPNLVTKETFADVEVRIEFMIAKGSNAGVKLNGQYEIQILDSFGKEKLTGDDCGGVYPRAADKPRYHTIDEGVPPRVNACKKPGEWQSLHIVFRAPHFDAEGKKVADACFVKVVLNDQVVQENVPVKYPTGAAWVNKEVGKGPLLLQSDHGPVAWRNARIRVLPPETKE